MMTKIRKSNAGFTLVELIVVIAIIGVLAAVLAPQYVKWVERGRVAADINTAETLLTAVNVAIVDAGVDGKDIGSGTITMDANETKVEDAATDTDTDTDMEAALEEILGADWKNAKITNKKATLENMGQTPVSPQTDETLANTYTINYNADGARGAWSETPTP